MKRKIAILTTMILLTTTVFTSTVLADVDDTQPRTDVLFEDDFNSYTQEDADDKKTAMTNAGWGPANAYADITYITGTNFVAPKTGNASVILPVSKLGDYSGWQNYTVETKVTFSEGELTTTVYAAIMARYGEDADGYDLRLYETPDGEQGIEVYCRKSDAKGNVQNVLDNSTITFNRGEAVDLKFTLNGATLKGYVNGELKFKGFDESVSQGWAGISKRQGSLTEGAENCGIDVVFDDFKVTTTDVLFYDNFSGYTDESVEMSDKGWDKKQTELSPNFDVLLDRVNGYYCVNRTNYITTLDAMGAYGWNDYVVQADVQISEGAIGESTYDEETGTTTYSKGSVYVGVAGRAIERAQSGYELTIYINMNTNGVVSEGVRLYRRNCTKLGVANSGDTDETILVEMDIEQGRNYELALEFKGNQIYGYVDGERVISYTADTTANYYSHGFAKMWSSFSGTTSVNAITDNFVVYKQDLAQEKFYEDFNNYANNSTEMQSDSTRWTVANKSSSRYCDGNAYTISGTATATPQVVTSISFTGRHFIQTEITFGEGTPTADLYAGISGCKTETAYNKSGYEFAIYQKTDGSVGARLNRVKNADATIKASTLKEDTLANLSSGTITTLTKGVPHVIKMEFDGIGGIKCYLDGILLITATDINYLSGYAGIRVDNPGCGVSVSYDNFAVYDYSYVSEVIGDVDASGFVATADITKLQDVLLKKEEETAPADVNKDAACNIVDLIRLDKLITSF